jgi:nitrogen regulatory protein PII-like uncharacterized protein
MSEAETKRKAVYLVEYQDKEPNEWNGVSSSNIEHENASKALSWIRNNGVNGKSYRVVRVVAGPFMCKTESVTKRTLQ